MTEAYDTTEDVEMASGQGNSFKEIVMSQLRRVATLASVEFRGGFYTKIPTKHGEEKEIYVQDTREVFSNSIIILAMLLKPKFDDITTEKFETYIIEKETITQDFIDKSSVKEEVILGDDFYTNEKDKILLETYKNKKLKLHMDLFSDISLLLAKKNYMEIIGGVDE